MTTSSQDPTACTVRQVPALDLRLGDTVIDHGVRHQIVTARLEGAHPYAVIGYADSTELHHYPVGHRLTILAD
ncbi:hypothetical protein [Nakamurella lactea]|uniref:hypothetical protein n=1 Tax=Nakamurella lactea TaxID=459515 RepID=UPI0004067853|nr:hypothetical protein [Nakamurella lactea]